MTERELEGLQLAPGLPTTGPRLLLGNSIVTRATQNFAPGVSGPAYNLVVSFTDTASDSALNYYFEVELETAPTPAYPYWSFRINVKNPRTTAISLNDILGIVSEFEIAINIAYRPDAGEDITEFSETRRVTLERMTPATADIFNPPSVAALTRRVQPNSTLEISTELAANIREEQPIRTAFDLGGQADILASFGLSLKDTERTLYFALLDPTSSTTTPGSGSRNFCAADEAYLTIAGRNLRAAKEFDYEEGGAGSSRPTLPDPNCRLGVSFNGNDFKFVGIDLPVGTTVNRGMRVTNLNEVYGCAAGSTNCYYADVNLGILDIDDAPLIQTVTDGINATEGEGLLDAYQTSPSPASINGLTLSPADIYEDLTIHDGDLSSNRSAFIAIDPSTVRLVGVSPTHGSDLFELVHDTANGFRLKIDAAKLDFERFQPQELQDGKAIYKITVVATDGTSDGVATSQLPGRAATSSPNTATVTLDFEVRDVIFRPVFVSPVGAPNPVPATDFPLVLGDRIEGLADAGLVYLLPGSGHFINDMTTIGRIAAVNPETGTDADLVYALFGGVGGQGVALDCAREDFDFRSSFDLIDNTAGTGRQMEIVSPSLSVDSSPNPSSSVLSVMVSYDKLLPAASSATERFCAQTETDQRNADRRRFLVTDNLAYRDQRAAVDTIKFTQGNIDTTVLEGRAGNRATNADLANKLVRATVIGKDPRFGFTPGGVTGLFRGIENLGGSNNFDMSESSGEFTTTAALEFANPGIYNLPAYVVDEPDFPLTGGNLNRADITIVRVVVEDINTAPAFSGYSRPLVNGAINLTLAENSAVDTEILRFTITDDNERAPTDFSVVSSLAQLKLDIEPTGAPGQFTGIVRLAQKLDYETTPSHTGLTLRVTDRGEYEFHVNNRSTSAKNPRVNTRTETLTLNIEVQDSREAAQLSAPTAPQFTVSESVANNFEISDNVLSITNANELASAFILNATTPALTAPPQYNFVAEIVSARLSGSGLSQAQLRSILALRPNSHSGNNIQLGLNVANPVLLAQIGDGAVFTVELSVVDRINPALSASQTINLRVVDDPNRQASFNNLGTTVLAPLTSLSISEVDVAGFRGARTHTLTDFPSFNEADISAIFPDLTDYSLAGGRGSTTSVRFRLAEQSFSNNNRLAQTITGPNILRLSGSGPNLQLHVDDNDFIENALFGSAITAKLVAVNSAGGTSVNTSISVSVTQAANKQVIYTPAAAGQPPAYKVDYQQTAFGQALPAATSARIIPSAGLTSSLPAHSNINLTGTRADDPGELVDTVNLGGSRGWFIARSTDPADVAKFALTGSSAANRVRIATPGVALAADDVVILKEEGGNLVDAQAEFDRYFELSNGASASPAFSGLQIRQKTHAATFADSSSAGNYNALDTLVFFESPTNIASERDLTYYLRSRSSTGSQNNASNYALAQFSVTVTPAVTRADPNSAEPAVFTYNTAAGGITIRNGLVEINEAAANPFQTLATPIVIATVSIVDPDLTETGFASDYTTPVITDGFEPNLFGASAVRVDTANTNLSFDILQIRTLDDADITVEAADPTNQFRWMITDTYTNLIAGQQDFSGTGNVNTIGAEDPQSVTSASLGNGALNTIDQSSDDAMQLAYSIIDNDFASRLNPTIATAVKYSSAVFTLTRPNTAPSAEQGQTTCTFRHTGTDTGSIFDSAISPETAPVYLRVRGDGASSVSFVERKLEKTGSADLTLGDIKAASETGCGNPPIGTRITGVALGGLTYEYMDSQGNGGIGGLGSAAVAFPALNQGGYVIRGYREEQPDFWVHQYVQRGSGNIPGGSANSPVRNLLVRNGTTAGTITLRFRDKDPDDGHMVQTDLGGNGNIDRSDGSPASAWPANPSTALTPTISNVGSTTGCGTELTVLVTSATSWTAVSGEAAEADVTLGYTVAETFNGGTPGSCEVVLGTIGEDGQSAVFSGQSAASFTMEVVPPAEPQQVTRPAATNFVIFQADAAGGRNLGGTADNITVRDANIVAPASKDSQNTFTVESSVPAIDTIYKRIFGFSNATYVQQGEITRHLQLQNAPTSDEFIAIRNANTPDLIWKVTDANAPSSSNREFSGSIKLRFFPAPQGNLVRDTASDSNHFGPKTAGDHTYNIIDDTDEILSHLSLLLGSATTANPAWDSNTDFVISQANYTSADFEFEDGLDSGITYSCAGITALAPRDNRGAPATGSHHDSPNFGYGTTLIDVFNLGGVHSKPATDHSYISVPISSWPLVTNERVAPFDDGPLAYTIAAAPLAPLGTADEIQRFNRGITAPSYNGLSGKDIADRLIATSCDTMNAATANALTIGTKITKITLKELGFRVRPDRLEHELTPKATPDIATEDSNGNIVTTGNGVVYSASSLAGSSATTPTTGSSPNYVKEYEFAEFELLPFTGSNHILTGHRTATPTTPQSKTHDLVDSSNAPVTASIAPGSSGNKVFFYLVDNDRDDGPSFNNANQFSGNPTPNYRVGGTPWARPAIDTTATTCPTSIVTPSITDFGSNNYYRPLSAFTALTAPTPADMAHQLTFIAAADLQVSGTFPPGTGGRAGYSCDIAISAGEDGQTVTSTATLNFSQTNHAPALGSSPASTTAASGEATVTGGDNSGNLFQTGAIPMLSIHEDATNNAQLATLTVSDFELVMGQSNLASYLTISFSGTNSNLLNDSYKSANLVVMTSPNNSTLTFDILLTRDITSADVSTNLITWIISDGGAGGSISGSFNLAIERDDHAPTNVNIVAAPPGTANRINAQTGLDSNLGLSFSTFSFDDADLTDNGHEVTDILFTSPVYFAFRTAAGQDYDCDTAAGSSYSYDPTGNHAGSTHTETNVPIRLAGNSGNIASSMSLRNILTSASGDSRCAEGEMPIGSQLEYVDFGRIQARIKRPTESDEAADVNNLYTGTGTSALAGTYSAGTSPYFVLTGYRRETPTISESPLSGTQQDGSSSGANDPIQPGGTLSITYTATDTDTDDGTPTSPTNAHAVRTDGTGAAWQNPSLSSFDISGSGCPTAAQVIDVGRSNFGAWTGSGATATSSITLAFKNNVGSFDRFNPTGLCTFTFTTGEDGRSLARTFSRAFSNAGLAPTSRDTGLAIDFTRRPGISTSIALFPSSGARGRNQFSETISYPGSSELGGLIITSSDLNASTATASQVFTTSLTASPTTDIFGLRVHTERVPPANPNSNATAIYVLVLTRAITDRDVGEYALTWSIDNDTAGSLGGELDLVIEARNNNAPTNTRFETRTSLTSRAVSYQTALDTNLGLNLAISGNDKDLAEGSTNSDRRLITEVLATDITYTFASPDGNTFTCSRGSGTHVLAGGGAAGRNPITGVTYDYTTDRNNPSFSFGVPLTLSGNSVSINNLLGASRQTTAGDSQCAESPLIGTELQRVAVSDLQVRMRHMTGASKMAANLDDLTVPNTNTAITGGAIAVRGYRTETPQIWIKDYTRSGGSVKIPVGQSGTSMEIDPDSTGLLDLIVLDSDPDDGTPASPSLSGAAAANVVRSSSPAAAWQLPSNVNQLVSLGSGCTSSDLSFAYSGTPSIAAVTGNVAQGSIALSYTVGAMQDKSCLLNLRLGEDGADAELTSFSVTIKGGVGRAASSAATSTDTDYASSFPFSNGQAPITEGSQNPSVDLDGSSPALASRVIATVSIVDPDLTSQSYINDYAGLTIVDGFEPDLVGASSLRLDDATNTLSFDLLQIRTLDDADIATATTDTSNMFNWTITDNYTPSGTQNYSGVGNFLITEIEDPQTIVSSSLGTGSLDNTNPSSTATAIELGYAISDNDFASRLKPTATAVEYGSAVFTLTRPAIAPTSERGDTRCAYSQSGSIFEPAAANVPAPAYTRVRGNGASSVSFTRRQLQKTGSALLTLADIQGATGTGCANPPIGTRITALELDGVTYDYDKDAGGTASATEVSLGDDVNFAASGGSGGYAIHGYRRFQPIFWVSEYNRDIRGSILSVPGDDSGSLNTVTVSNGTSGSITLRFRDTDPDDGHMRAPNLNSNSAIDRTGGTPASVWATNPATALANPTLADGNATTNCVRDLTLSFPASSSSWSAVSGSEAEAEVTLEYTVASIFNSGNAGSCMVTLADIGEDGQDAIFAGTSGTSFTIRIPEQSQPQQVTRPTAGNFVIFQKDSGRTVSDYPRALGRTAGRIVVSDNNIIDASRATSEASFEIDSSVAGGIYANLFNFTTPAYISNAQVSSNLQLRRPPTTQEIIDIRAASTPALRWSVTDTNPVDPNNAKVSGDIPLRFFPTPQGDLVRDLDTANSYFGSDAASTQRYNIIDDTDEIVSQLSLLLGSASTDNPSWDASTEFVISQANYTSADFEFEDGLDSTSYECAGITAINMAERNNAVGKPLAGDTKFLSGSHHDSPNFGYGTTFLDVFNLGPPPRKNSGNIDLSYISVPISSWPLVTNKRVAPFDNGPLAYTIAAAPLAPLGTADEIKRFNRGITAPSYNGLSGKDIFDRFVATSCNPGNSVGNLTIGTKITKITLKELGFRVRPDGLERELTAKATPDIATEDNTGNIVTTGNGVVYSASSLPGSNGTTPTTGSSPNYVSEYSFPAFELLPFTGSEHVLTGHRTVPPTIPSRTHDLVDISNTPLSNTTITPSSALSKVFFYFIDNDVDDGPSFDSSNNIVGGPAADPTYRAGGAPWGAAPVINSIASTCPASVVTRASAADFGGGNYYRPLTAFTGLTDARTLANNLDLHQSMFLAGVDLQVASHFPFDVVGREGLNCNIAFSAGEDSQAVTSTAALNFRHPNLPPVLIESNVSLSDGSKGDMFQLGHIPTLFALHDDVNANLFTTLIVQDYEITNQIPVAERGSLLNITFSPPILIAGFRERLSNFVAIDSPANSTLGYHVGLAREIRNSDVGTTPITWTLSDGENNLSGVFNLVVERDDHNTTGFGGQEYPTFDGAFTSTHPNVVIPGKGPLLNFNTGLDAALGVHFQRLDFRDEDLKDGGGNNVNNQLDLDLRHVLGELVYGPEVIFKFKDHNDINYDCTVSTTPYSSRAVGEPLGIRNRASRQGDRGAGLVADFRLGVGYLPVRLNDHLTNPTFSSSSTSLRDIFNRSGCDLNNITIGTLLRNIDFDGIQTRLMRGKGEMPLDADLEKVYPKPPFAAIANAQWGVGENTNLYTIVGYRTQPPTLSSGISGGTRQDGTDIGSNSIQPGGSIVVTYTATDTDPDDGTPSDPTPLNHRGDNFVGGGADRRTNVVRTDGTGSAWQQPAISNLAISGAGCPTDPADIIDVNGSSFPNWTGGATSSSSITLRFRNDRPGFDNFPASPTDCVFTLTGGEDGVTATTSFTRQLSRQGLTRPAPQPAPPQPATSVISATDVSTNFAGINLAHNVSANSLALDTGGSATPLGMSFDFSGVQDNLRQINPPRVVSRGAFTRSVFYFEDAASNQFTCTSTSALKAPLKPAVLLSDVTTTAGQPTFSGTGHLRDTGFLPFTIQDIAAFAVEDSCAQNLSRTGTKRLTGVLLQDLGFSFSPNGVAASTAAPGAPPIDPATGRSIGANSFLLVKDNDLKLTFATPLTLTGSLTPRPSSVQVFVEAKTNATNQVSYADPANLGDPNIVSSSVILERASPGDYSVRLFDTGQASGLRLYFDLADTNPPLTGTGKINFAPGSSQWSWSFGHSCSNAGNLNLVTDGPATAQLTTSPAAAIVPSNTQVIGRITPEAMHIFSGNRRSASFNLYMEFANGFGGATACDLNLGFIRSGTIVNTYNIRLEIEDNTANFQLPFSFQASDQAGRGK